MEPNPVPRLGPDALAVGPRRPAGLVCALPDTPTPQEPARQTLDRVLEQHGIDPNSPFQVGPADGTRGSGFHINPGATAWIGWIVLFALLVALLSLLIKSLKRPVEHQSRNTPPLPNHPSPPAPIPPNPPPAFADADARAATGDWVGALRVLLAWAVHQSSVRLGRTTRPYETARAISQWPGLPAEFRKPFEHLLRVEEEAVFGDRLVGATEWALVRDLWAPFAGTRS